jgi:hypothetical protein
MSAPKKPDNSKAEQADASFLVAFTRSSRLDAFLRTYSEKSYSPVTVAQHPIQPHQALVIFQKTDQITLYKSPTGTFRSFNSAITGKLPDDWRSNLQHDLNQLYEQNTMDFIGSVIDESGGFNFAFCQHDQGDDLSSSFYVVSISQPVDAEYLQSTINEQQIDKHGCYRAAIFYEGEVLIVFEVQRRPAKKNYIVTEIPYVSAEGFEQEFVNKIELCTMDQKLEFSGLASCRLTQQLFLVLAIDLS